MTRLTWDNVGERTYEVGVDRGVLFLPDEAGVYNNANPWNGLVTVTEKPSGADANPQYADNIKYLNLIAAEQFGATVEAFTYPDAFAECDGTATPSPGVLVGQQSRKVFGLAFRSQVGNDVDGVDHGYKLHLIYGAQASPSEKAYGTINDKPEAITFSWDVSTTPIPVTDLKPTAQLVVDSTKVAADDLATLEGILFGTAETDARLPSPDEVIALFGAGLTEVSLVSEANQPTFVEGTGVLTLPNVTGVQWVVNGVNKAAGAQPAAAPGAVVDVTAVAKSGYTLAGDTDWTFERP